MLVVYYSFGVLFTFSKELGHGIIDLLNALGGIDRVQDGALGLESFNDGKAGFDMRLEPFADDLNFVIGSSRVLGSLEQASNSVRPYSLLV